MASHSAPCRRSTLCRFWRTIFNPVLHSVAHQLNMATPVHRFLLKILMQSLLQPQHLSQLLSQRQNQLLSLHQPRRRKMATASAGAHSVVTIHVMDV